MKRFLPIFVFLCSISFAQTFNLNWDGVKEISVGETSKVNVPFFTNDGFYYDSENIPHFSYLKPVDRKSNWELYNLNTSTINSLGDIERSTIPNELNYDLRVVSANGKLTLVLDIPTIFKENNQIKRVNSFSIRQLSQVSNSDVVPNFAGSADTSNASVLSQGNWYKISVDTTGVFKLDYSFFTSNGIPTNFNTSNLRIFGNGGAMLHESPGNFRYGALQENAIMVVDGGDNQFNSGDYVLFYAQGPHTFDRRDDNLSQIEHRYNIYEEKAYYFINFDGGTGKRIQQQNVGGTPVETFTTFDDYQFFEEDETNIYNTGRQWLGNNFTLENSRTYSFNAPSLVTSQPIFVDYRFVSVNAINNQVSVDLNGNSIGNFTINYFNSNTGLFFQSQGSGSSTSSSLDVNVNVDNSANPQGVVYLDYLRVKYKQNLSFAGGQMRFRDLSIVNDGSVYQFQFSNASMEYVWNVSDITNARQIVMNGNSFNYQSTSTNFLNEFIAFNSDDAYTPVYESAVANQNIRSLQNIDYIIVTHPQFISQSNRIANLHNSRGLSTAVVTTDQVFNEYGSGSSDLTAIRDFFSHLYTKGDLEFALLFGASSYDFKDRISNNTNLIPSFQSFNSRDLDTSFVTDDYFAIVDETGTNISSESALLSSPQMDIAVGRLPARNSIEAEIMTEKTLAYYNSPDSFGDWRTRLHFVVDDNDCNNQFDMPIDTYSAGFIEQNYPQYTLRKLYADAFQAEVTSGGQRYPTVEDAINSAVETGSLFVNYFGHGGFRGWAQERLLTFESVTQYNNFNPTFKRLPLIMTITCDFTIWDVPQLESAGENFLTNPTGGAAIMLTTSRAIGVNYGINFNPIVVEKLFTINPNNTNEYLSVAEALRQAKIQDGNNINHYRVNIMGDPALSLARPPRTTRLTRINNEDTATFNGTLRALDFVTFEGEVLNASGNLDSNFNGRVTASLFDKAENKSVRNNDGCRDEDEILEFSEQTSVIFRGTTDVTNGTFKIEFFIPKDINFNVGDGKLLLYAENGVTDAVGFDNTISVGGLNPDGVNDGTGPAIGLYMNNLNFVNGGITDRDPYILACLVDDTGINATGVGIGHDIIGVLNEDLEGTIVLNEFYEGGEQNPCINSEFEDYQKGRVLYQLRNLDLGEYTLRFRAWDINNNSATETLDFVVLEDGSQQLFIEKLLNWPNPFTNQTYFQFEHNCDSELEVLVQIFTVTGKIVKTIQQTVSSEPWLEGYRTGRFEIPWDGLDDFGNKIGKGVYVYKATVRGTNSELCNGSASEIEKLVILK